MSSSQDAELWIFASAKYRLAVISSTLDTRLLDRTYRGKGKLWHVPELFFVCNFASDYKSLLWRWLQPIGRWVASGCLLYWLVWLCIEQMRPAKSSRRRLWKRRHLHQNLVILPPPPGLWKSSWNQLARTKVSFDNNVNIRLLETTDKLQSLDNNVSINVNDGQSPPRQLRVSSRPRAVTRRGDDVFTLLSRPSFELGWCFDPNPSALPTAFATVPVECLSSLWLE